MDVRVGVLLLHLIVQVTAPYPGLCVPDAENACRDYSSADQCQLTEYCKINVWSHSLESESKLCQICKADITNVQKFITANTTRDFVKYDLLALCRACPFAAGRNECTTLINANFEKIYDDVVDKVDPNVICRALHICQESKHLADTNDIITKKVKARLSLGPLWLPGPVRIEDNICSTREKCSNYSIAQKCSVLNTCKQSVWSTPVKTSPVCDACKAEIKKIHDWVADNKTEAEIKKELLMFCDQIPIQSLQQKCHNMVDLDFEVIYKDIIAFLDANIVCSALGLCVPSYQIKSPASCELDAKHACLDYASAVECNTLNYCQYVVWNTPVQKSGLCNCCLSDIDKLRERLDANRTREIVEADFLALCKLMPWQSLKFQCQTTVLHNFERIYQDVINYLNATVICRAFYLCRNQGQEDVLVDAFLNAIAKHDSEDDNLGCLFCKGQIKALQDWMRSTTTKQDVDKKLHEICDDVKLTAFREECQTLVSEHFDEIYDNLIAKTDPDVLCKRLKVCVSSSRKEIASVPDSCTEKDPCSDYNTAKKCGALERCKAGEWSKPVLRDDNICRLCQDEIKAMQDFVKDNATQTEVKERLVSFCNEMKLSAFKNECLSFVNDNFDDIYADLVAMLDPSTVCTYLKLCNQVTEKAPELSPEEVAASCYGAAACEDYTSAIRCGKLEQCKATYWALPVKAGPVCSLCMDEIDVLQKWLKSDPVVAQVKEAMNGFCEAIPLTAFREACLSNIQKNFDQVYSDLTALVNNQIICVGLKLCKTNSTAYHVNDMMNKLPTLLKKAMQDHKLPIRAPFDPVMTCKVTPDDACYDLSSARQCDAIGQCKKVWSRPVEKGRICDFCKKEIARLSHAINGSRENVRNTLNKICSIIPFRTRRDSCLENVKYNFDFIYNIILLALTPDGFCSSLRLCSAAEDRALLTGSTSCVKCESFVGDFQNEAFNNNEIMAALLKLMKPECDNLDGNGAMCDMVTYQMAMEHGRQPANPATVCKATNMCSVGDEFGDDICSNCMAFFERLQEEVKSNPVIVERLVHAASEFYCLQKPMSLRTQCVKYVTMVIDVMIKSMEVKDVAKICQGAQFCGATPAIAHNWKEFTRTTQKLMLDLMTRRPGQVAGEPCADCRTFVTDLQTAIRNKDPIVMQLVTLVQSQCRTLGELSGLCEDFIKGHYQDVLNQFVAYTVDQVCDAMRMCPKSKKAANGDLCTDCKAFFEDWQVLIVNNRSLVNQDLDDLRTALCSQVPGFLKGECDNVFDKESGTIVTALSTQTPEQTCSDTLFCDEVEKDPATQSVIAKTPSSSKVEIPGACEVCEAVMKYVDDHIDYNATEKEIEQLLLDVCSHIPEYGKQCDYFVEKYIDTIVKLIIEEGTSPLLVCKALQLCAAPPAKVNNPFTCEVCEEVMKYIDHFIDYNSTEKEIDHLLMEVCSKLPSKYSQECDNFVKKYADEVIRLILEEGTSPLVVCKLLMLCDAPPPKVNNVNGPAECDMCMYVFTEIQHVLADSTIETDIVNELGKICTVIGKYQAECKLLVNDYGAVIIKILANEVDPASVCKLVKLCPKSEDPPKKPAVDSGALCGVCTLVADELDEILSENSTETEIENALEKVCSFIPGEFKDTCDDIVTQNFKMIMDFLIKEMNPKEICVQLKLCPAVENTNSGVLCEVCELVASQLDDILSENSTQTEIEDALKRVCGLIPGKYAATCDALVEQYFKLIVDFLVNEMNPKVICVQIKVCPAQERAKSGTLCEVCELVAGQLDAILSENSTQTEIEDALKKVCGLIPGKYSATCDALIEEYFQFIVDFLVNEMNPKVICVQIKVCPAQERVKSGALCEVCQLVATELDNMLSDKSTQTEIEDALERVCTILPAGFKTTCDNLIKNNFQAIVDILVNEMNPKVICVQIKVCPAENNVKFGPECIVCRLIATKLDEMLSEKSTQTEIENALETVCSYLPGDFKPTCDNLIKENFQTIVNILVNEMNPKVICVQIHVCPAKETTKSGALCEVCQLVATQLDTMLSDKSTQAEIKNALETVCNYLPTQFKTTCDSLISENFDKIVGFLVKEMNPKVICVQLGVCPAKVKSDPGIVCGVCTLVAVELDRTLSDRATQADIEQALKNVCDRLPGGFKTTCDSMITEHFDAMVAFLVKELNPKVICVQLHICPSLIMDADKCEMCKLAAGAVEDLLKNPDMATAFDAALKEICNLLPSEVRPTCQTIMDQAGKELFSVLVKEMDPDVFCNDISFCPKKVEKIDNHTKCAVCELVAAQLETLLSNDLTQDGIKVALGSVCRILPQRYRDACISIITRNFDGFMNIVIEEFKPAILCGDLKICPAPQPVKFPGECTLCDLVMDELEKVLSEESTEKEILAVVMSICDTIPSSYKDQCDLYIKDYGPGVISILVDDFVPKKVCAKLHMCASKVESTKVPVMKLHVGSEECYLCKEVIKALDDILDQNYTEDAVKRALKIVCSKLPTSLQSECDSLVDEYAALIFQYIDNIADPSFVCQHIGLCPTDLKHAQLLGGDKCTYGPSYWCRDMETAKACNAVQHCMDHVW